MIDTQNKKYLTEERFGVELKLVRESFDDIYSRFDRVDERFVLIDQRFEQIDQRFEQVDKRFEQVDQRFEQIDKRFEQVDKRFDYLNEKMMGGFDAVIGAIEDIGRKIDEIMVTKADREEVFALHKRVLRLENKAA